MRRWTRQDEHEAARAEAALETVAFPRAGRGALALRLLRQSDGACVCECEALEPASVPPFTARFLSEVAAEHGEDAAVLGAVFGAGHEGDLEPGDAVYVYDARTLVRHAEGRAVRVFFRARDNRTAWVVVA